MAQEVVTKFDKQFDKHDPDREKDLKEAEEYFDEMIKVGHPYICLSFSHHWCSEGYWVESTKPDPESLHGHIIKEYKKHEQ